MKNKKDAKWCPQHGYPLPCDKCGMPLAQPLFSELLLKLTKQGRKEVVDWVETQRVAGLTLIQGIGEGIPISEKEWQAKLKEWGLDGSN